MTALQHGGLENNGTPCPYPPFRVVENAFNIPKIMRCHCDLSVGVVRSRSVCLSVGLGKQMIQEVAPVARDLARASSPE